MSVIIDGSAGVTTNAGGSVNPSTTIDGINYSCRAWVNFNGTGTPAIRASGNVTSITDVNTGRYVVNITTAMPDANGAAVGTAIPGTASDANSNRIVYAACISTTTVRLNITSVTSGTDWQDSEFVSVAIFR